MCLFAEQAVPYLGFLVIADGVQVKLAKLAAIRDCPTPSGVPKLRSFMGVFL